MEIPFFIILIHNFMNIVDKSFIKTEEFVVFRKILLSFMKYHVIF